MAEQTAASGSPAESKASPPQDRSQAAFARYQREMRRSRAIYYALLAVVLAALGSWVGVAWSRGEVAHTTLHTFAPAPPTLGVQEPSPTQAEAWRSSDRLAIGTPQWGGTVVTFSQHTVAGRDARTGRTTWTYTRSDRDVCTAAQIDGTAVAVYENKGNCDQVSAFDSDTGRRRWTRTLDMDGTPINGVPRFQVTPFTLVVASQSVIYAIATDSGYNRWTYDRWGCRIRSVVLGSAGALISQTCSSEVRCDDQKFCGRGPQLLLRDGVNGRDDDNKTNPDRIKWNLMGNTGIPVSADNALISTADPSGGELTRYAAADGRELAPIGLSPKATSLGNATAVETTTAEIIWLSGVTYAIGEDDTASQWRIPTAAPPVVTPAPGDSTPALSSARITVPAADGVGIIDGSTGKITVRFRLGATATRAYPLGTGFLLAGPTGVIAFR